MSYDVELVVVFLSGFGLASLLAFLLFGRYLGFIEKIQDMFIEFKNEGHKGKWLK